MSQDEQALREARNTYIKKCAQFSNTNMGVGVHFTAGWKARQQEVDQQAELIKQVADICEAAEKLTLEARSQRDELQRINTLLFQDAYSVYTDACESAGHDPEPMEVWQQKYLRVIDRQAKAKAGTK